jgi:hypothetical protein
MSKILIGLAVLVLTACNNDGKSSSSEDTTVSNMSGVENVNGNIPDTTNTLTVEGSSQSTDASVDSTKKQ